MSRAAHNTAAAATSSTLSRVMGSKPPRAYFVPLTATPHSPAAITSAAAGPRDPAILGAPSRSGLSASVWELPVGAIRPDAIPPPRYFRSAIRDATMLPRSQD